jgi:uncharacterized protein (DUF433 family)
MSTQSMSSGAPAAAGRGIAEHIVITPGVCGGKPRIAGHRIKVSQVAVWHERQGQSAAEIVAGQPGLTLADVYAALAYYHDHRDEIDAEIRLGDEVYERLRTHQPSLLEKLAGRRPDVIGLSSAAALAYVQSGHCPTEDLQRLRADLPRRWASSPGDPDLVKLEEELGRRLSQG